MSRFRKLSHTLWHCQYHIVWVPKYRYKIFDGPIKDAAYNGIHAICGYAGCEVVEMNVQNDHVHLVVMVPPKLAISDLMGRLKGHDPNRKHAARRTTEAPTSNAPGNTDGFSHRFH